MHLRGCVCVCVSVETKLHLVQGSRQNYFFFCYFLYTRRFVDGCVCGCFFKIPTVRGKSRGWKRGGPRRVRPTNLWDWDHLLRCRARGFFFPPLLLFCLNEHDCPWTQTRCHTSSISLTYGHHGTEEGEYICMLLCVCVSFLMGFVKRREVCVCVCCLKSWMVLTTGLKWCSCVFNFKVCVCVSAGNSCTSLLFTGAHTAPLGRGDHLLRQSYRCTPLSCRRLPTLDFCRSLSGRPPRRRARWQDSPHERAASTPVPGDN